MEPYASRSTMDDGNGRLRQSVIVANPQGLHLRPAMAFAKCAQQFDASVSVLHGDRSVNGKSLIDLMLLAAEHGSELIVEVHGNDAKTALPALTEILASPSADHLEGDLSSAPN